MFKNVTQNAFLFEAIQTLFANAYAQINNYKRLFLEELQREAKEQGGIKKDYFLSYNKKKDRALSIEKNIFEEILKLKRALLQLKNQ